MCLIAFAWQPDGALPLVIAANRDEFYARPAAPAGFWESSPEIFGGRDLTQGGGWLALSLRGRLACVTNVRRMVPPNPASPSRGALVSGFVRGAQSAQLFCEQLATQAGDYAGFNLLLWDGKELRYATNDPHYRHAPVTPGVHALSNAALDTPWPKAQRLHAAMAAWLDTGAPQPQALLAALADPLPAADAELPNTGVGRELERMLSSPFIASGGYGTRASTVVVVHRDGQVEFSERRFGSEGVPQGETHQRLELAAR